MWENIWLIISKPDNVPIVLMVILVGFYTWKAISMGLQNDRLRREWANSNAASGDGAKTPPPDIFYPAEEQQWAKRVHCFPFLVKVEFLAALVVTVGLLIWSIALDAPLEEPANPNFTPNPSKAPWYFLGLQELLVYFDPWIAGVILPTLIIVGLMAIPYLDSQPERGNGYYTFKERKFAILAFLFGFIGLWVIEVIIGTFMRGPGWMWFWPWQRWDPHRVIAETNVNLNDFLGLQGNFWAFFVGFVAISGYYFVTMTGTYIFAVRRNLPDLKLGLVRFSIKYLLYWTMMAIPVKILLRLLLHIKYVMVTPWFNV